jgi:hypothetical protein
MTAITRRALRVCTALTELKGKGGDVLDALIPFFEPLLELCNGKVFDPQVFAIGVQKLYHWRFTRDIAEQFIPRFERAGFLERKTSGIGAVFIVRYVGQISEDQPSLSGILNTIIDEFEKFPPLVTDLLSYNKTREELTDILIRFLVSLDAYAPAAFASEVRSLNLGAEAESVLNQIEEGGRPLAHEDKYMAARFVQHLCSTRPEFLPDLARLASIGLLTEVVEDFLKPVQIEAMTDLTIIVDAPLALDYLGCSGKVPRDDVRCIFESLRQIGCSFVVLPVTCTEIHHNLKSMLAISPADRHGYTHNAMLKKEVMPDYVQAVAYDPEKALQNAGITVRSLTLDALPSQHNFFSRELYEDFFDSIMWVAEVAPREHDATCLALTMRLRAGQHRSDLFRCKYVFVTRNPRFVRDARDYCLKSRLIAEIQVSPVIHQRELATIAWLRTGLGASETVPRGHLLAACDRVLNLRTEVRDAVGQKLRSLTPDKLEQYELLLLDQRSLRRLADQTLNDETVITDENAEQLLDAMRRATVEEERIQYEQKLKREQELTASARAAAKENAKERDLALAQLDEFRIAHVDAIKHIAMATTDMVGRVDRAMTWIIYLLAALIASNYLFGWLAAYRIPAVIIGFILALFGGYNQLMNALEKPKIGVPTLMGCLARRIFVGRLKQAGLENSVRLEHVKFDRGRVTLNDALIDLPSPSGLNANI